MTNVNFSEMEEKILKFWKKNKIFEKSLEAQNQSPRFVFYDGPPFATGLPHYGHILASTIKDVIGRYKTMKGFYVRRRWGWDCHGLPIENIIEQELKISGKKQIEKTGVDKFCDACREAVLKYANEWKKMVQRIGRWVEFDNSYKTMDTSYMESVWWAVKQIWDKKLIYEGRKVLPYCPRCETPISKFEIAMDHSYQELTEEAIFVKFQLKNAGLFPKNTYILVWTTTPWTLPSNVALAVNKNINYVLVKQGNNYYILAKDRLLELRGLYTVEKEIASKELFNLEYEPLYNLSLPVAGETKYKVLPADFVSADEGTGIVHIAPAYGEDDYNLGQEFKLPLVALLNETGVFNENSPGFLKNVYFKEADNLIKNDLEKRGLVYKKETYTHPYPFCWRCETMLYYSAISAWFIDIQKIKKRILELNEKIAWHPDHLKHGRFYNNIVDAPDWNISRNRYWASPLPFWKCDSKNCHITICLGSIKELKEKAINFNEVYGFFDGARIDLHKFYADQIKLKCPKCGKSMTRIKEVMDCWVESASMPFAELHFPFENNDLFKERFPAEFVAEYIAQTRTWFYYMLAISTLLFDAIPFRNVVATGTVLNEKGEKLSKSKKNYPDPWDVINKYGVDTLRFYLMSSVVMKAENLLFAEKEVDQTYKKVFVILFNILSFYKLYPSRAGSARASGADKFENPHILDKWILSLLNKLVKNVAENLDSYDTVSACRAIRIFIDDFSTWYLRRSRGRFKADGEQGKPRYQSPAGTVRGRPRRRDFVTLRGRQVFHHILMETAKIIAPLAPYIAEYIYKELGGKQKSVHLEEFPRLDMKMIDEKLHKNMEITRKIASIGLELRAKAGIKVRQPLKQLAINIKLDDDLLGLLKDELNVKEIIFNQKIKGVKWPVVEDSGLAVALDIEIIPELQAEGNLREITRHIQELRKKAGLTPKDKITIYWESENKEIAGIIEKNQESIKQDTISRDLKNEKVKKPLVSKEVMIDDKPLFIGIG